MPIIEREIKQGDAAWFAAKLGKPSASNAKRMIQTSGAVSKSWKGYAKELAVEKFTGISQGFEGNSHTDYGTETEEEARLAYSFLSDNVVEECAFIQNDLMTYLVSPDGLIGDDGLVEIKCKPKLHIDTLIYYKEKGDIPPDYKTQAQMQLMTSERKWCDLFYYSKTLPNLMVRIEPIPAIHKALKTQIQATIIERDRITALLREF